MYTFWTTEEENKLRSFTGKVSFFEMSKLFQDRTSISLQKKSIKMGLISGFKHKDHSHDENFFKTPNPLNCFIAGFFAADGCLAQRSFCIEVNQNDKSILENVIKATKFTGSVYNYSRNKYKREGQIHVSKLTICSIKKWTEDLKQNFGIVHNKTYRIGPPNLDDLYLKLCYIIGYTDGDGTICPPHNYDVKIGYSSCSIKILEWIKEILNLFLFKNNLKIRKRKNENCYEYHICHNKALILFNLLKDIPVPKFDRKWKNPQTLELLEKRKQSKPYLFQNNLNYFLEKYNSIYRI